jgi:very-short-patch-repair endonuclease
VTVSEAEDELAFQLKAVGIFFEREVLFAPKRRWRADFMIKHPRFIEPPLLVEIDGGTWSSSRHTSGAGFRRDLEKLNAATLAGYRVLRFLPEQVTSGAALQVIEQALA